MTVTARKTSKAYPTVVIVTNDHQNPSSDPRKKDLGKSTWFQFISCRENIVIKANCSFLFSILFSIYFSVFKYQMNWFIMAVQNTCDA